MPRPILFTLYLKHEGLMDKRRLEWINKHTWSPTWHAMNYVLWSTKFFLKPISKSWVQHKTKKPRNI